MQRKNLIILITLVLLCMILFAYIANKAAVSSFTHDESYSYNHYVHESFMDIISNKDSYTNNHLLNTLGMKYSEKLFGSSELALRLPNLLLLLVFFVYTILIFRKSNVLVQLSIFTLMFSNSIMIDFFGLARGYGMSIGFMIMSLYHLIKSYESENKHHLILFNIAALLAILSNFTMLDYYVAALFIFNLVKFFDCRYVSFKKFNFLKINKVNIILFIFSVIVLYEPVRRAFMYNTLDFGGKQGFIDSTMVSLLTYTISNLSRNNLWIMFLIIIVLTLALLPLLIFIKNQYLKKPDFLQNSKTLITINLLLIGISIITVVQHYIFKTDYLVGRFALFLYPLFILNLGFLYEYLLKMRFQVILHSVAIVLALLAVFNFYQNTNQYSCAEWAYDMNTKNMVIDLERAYIADALRDRNTPAQISLGINWLFEPTVNFYRTTWKLKWLKEVNRDGFNGNFHYYYVFLPDTAGLNLQKVIHIYNSSNTVFAK